VSDPLVLVVEEEPMVREVLVRYLERDGFRVDAWRTASRRSRRSRPLGRTHVLLDLMLPRVDGFEVFRRLRFPACSERSASQGTRAPG
jgi:DNA-binding response OmpR family regulator